MEGLVEMLGNGFFPIVMCGVLLFGGWKLFSKLFDDGIKTIKELTDAHSVETKELSRIVENNTEVVKGVVERLDKVEIKLDNIENKVDELDSCSKKGEKK